MDLSISAAKAINNGKVSSVRVYLAWTWKNDRPFYHLKDAISVNWDASTWILDANATFIAYTRNPLGVAVETITRPAVSTQGGLGYYIDLSKTGTAPSPYGTCAFSLKPVDSYMEDGNRYNSSINCIYGHSEFVANDIVINSSGSSVTISKHETQASAQATVTYGN